MNIHPPPPVSRFCFCFVLPKAGGRRELTSEVNACLFSPIHLLFNQ